MEIKFKKNIEALKGEITEKYADLEDIVRDFKPEIGKCEIDRKFIIISPECIRCNLCVEECPVDAIANAKANRPAKILEGCVKCEICAQTCPIRCIHVMESTSSINEQVTHYLRDLKVPHRTLRMKKIEVDEGKCVLCGTCAKFCPTGAITLEEETAKIDKDACMGCGACMNVCSENAIELERELGPVIKTKNLLINQEDCVACQMCEEGCPTGAIKLEGDKIIFSEDKCILCEVCSNRCPVSALKLERLSYGS